MNKALLFNVDKDIQNQNLLEESDEEKGTEVFASHAGDYNADFVKWSVHSNSNQILMPMPRMSIDGQGENRRLS